MLNLNHIILANIKAPGHKAIRGRNELSKFEDDHFFLNFQMLGDYQLSQQNDQLFVPAGAPALIDNAQAFELDFDPLRKMNLISLRFPRATILGQGKRQDLRSLNRQLANCANAGLLRSQFRLLSDALSRDDLNSAKFMTYSVVQLLIQFLHTDENTQSPEVDIKEKLFSQYKAFIKTHFNDANLSIGDIARHFGCSRRTIQSRFALTGKTFTQTLLQERLTFVCQRLLMEHREDKRQISRLAFDAGFQDVSTFYKAFNREYGVSPKVWQRSHLH